MPLPPTHQTPFSLAEPGTWTPGLAAAVCSMAPSPTPLERFQLIRRQSLWLSQASAPWPGSGSLLNGTFTDAPSLRSLSDCVRCTSIFSTGCITGVSGKWSCVPTLKARLMTVSLTSRGTSTCNADDRTAIDCPMTRTKASHVQCWA